MGILIKITCILSILNCLQYGDFDQKYTTEKAFFLKGKKIEIRPGVSGSGRNGLESILNTSTETFDTFP